MCCVLLEGIPTLVLLDENDELITTDGRSVIMKDTEGKVSTGFFDYLSICCCLQYDAVKLSLKYC